MLTDKPWLAGPYRTAGLATVLLAVNIYVCRELFGTEYLNAMGSIEAAFISIARWAADNWRDLTWAPFWYNGGPYQNTYPPLLHLTVAGLSNIAGWSAAHAYHFVTALFYCLGPLTLFVLALRLSGSRVCSFFAGLIYSLLSPSAFLILDVRQDLGSIWRARRLQTLLTYGEGPHVTGLAFLPLAILFLHLAISKRRPFWYVLAALAFAAGALTNWLAAAALAAATVAYLLAVDTGHRRAILTALCVAVLAYALAAPWLPPSTIKVIQFNARTIGGDFTHIYQALPRNALVILSVLALLKIALDRFRASLILQFAAYFTFLMGSVSLTASWWNIAILPQPHRYHTELELGIALLVPFALRSTAQRLPRKATIAFVCVLLIAAIYPAKQYRRYARLLMSPIDITTTLEYRAANWMKQNFGERERVLATGSVSFWLNTFTSTPQFGGGFDQGTINYMIRVAIYQLYSSDGTARGEDARIGDLWLKAFGVDAVQLGGPASREYFKPWRNPAKFAGFYPELWREGDDVIYRVPRRSRSLAHVITRADLAPRTPVNGIDVDPLRPYVAALENDAYPVAAFRWTSRHSAEIRADVNQGQILAVQVTHHPGWRADKGSISADAIGNMVVEPRCTGPCTILLTYDGGAEMLLARMAAWIAIGVCILLCFVPSLRNMFGRR